MGDPGQHRCGTSAFSLLRARMLLLSLHGLPGCRTAGAPNATSGGYFLWAPGVVSFGSVLATGSQPNASACAASCAARADCDVFNFCAAVSWAGLLSPVPAPCLAHEQRGRMGLESLDSTKMEC